jgi:hypothetical protein
MIGAAGTGRGFGGLVRYLMTGKDGDQPERAGWTETRNLMTDDPELVARIMRVTANVKGAGSRVENPAYHLSLSFALEDQTTRELETLVADRVLADIGLAGHQAFIVRHVDTDHAHVHIAINRVHPETGKVWDNSHDWTRIEKSLRHQERELGLRQVPGHLHVLDGQQRPERDESLTSGQRRQAKRTGRVPFAGRVREAAKADLQTAKGWQELAGNLARRGLWMEKKGRGLVLTDGEEWVKASSVDRKASLASLEKRLGEYRHYGRDYADRLRQDALAHEIAEPRQRREALQAAFAKSSQMESAGRQAQVIDLEAERDRYEAVLREARRQGQEIVTAISTDAANDNEERDNTCEQTPEEHSRTRRRGRRASSFRSPLRRRKARRFTGYRGKRKYRAGRRGKRFMNAGKKKRGKSASSNTGRIWTANAHELIQAQGTTRHPAPVNAIGQRRTLPPVPGF